MLKGLSDPVEAVRDVAFRACQTLTALYGKQHSGALLPDLEASIFAVDWRVRLAAVQLLGQLVDLTPTTHSTLRGYRYSATTCGRIRKPATDLVRPQQLIKLPE